MDEAVNRPADWLIAWNSRAGNWNRSRNSPEWINVNSFAGAEQNNIQIPSERGCQRNNNQDEWNNFIPLVQRYEPN